MGCAVAKFTLDIEGGISVNRAVVDDWAARGGGKRYPRRVFDFTVICYGAVKDEGCLVTYDAAIFHGDMVALGGVYCGGSSKLQRAGYVQAGGVLQGKIGVTIQRHRAGYVQAGAVFQDHFSAVPIDKKGIIFGDFQAIGARQSQDSVVI